MPQKAFAAEYLEKPPEWKQPIEANGLVAIVDGRPSAVVRLGSSSGSDLAIASIDVKSRSAVPAGQPFGIDGRDLFPQAWVSTESASRLVVLACDPGSEQDSCSHPSIEQFSREGASWRHSGTISTDEFKVSTWPSVTAALLDRVGLFVSVSNIDSGSTGSMGSTTMLVDDAGTARTVSRVDELVDATCRTGDSVIQLTHSSAESRANLVSLWPSQTAFSQLGSGPWSMSCEPTLLWNAGSAMRGTDLKPIVLPVDTQPVDASDGVVVTADPTGFNVQLVSATTEAVVATYNLGRPFGPISMAADESGQLIAMDVAPPDGDHLPVWIRTTSK